MSMLSKKLCQGETIVRLGQFAINITLKWDNHVMAKHPKHANTQEILFPIQFCHQ